LDVIPEVLERLMFEYDGAPSRKTLLRIAKANPEVAAYLAASIESPLDLLEQLSEVAPREVARNPNASLELLVRVGRKAPAELLENPILPLFALESPEKFQEMFKGLVSELLALDDPPPAVFRVDFLQTTKDQIRALFHPRVPQETVIALAGDHNHDVRESASKSRLLPPLYARLSSLIGDVWSQRSLSLSLSSAEFEQASQGPLWARILLASFVQTSEVILLELANNRSLQVQQKIASNPAASLRVLQRLEPFDRTVSWILAGRRGLPPEIFEKLIAMKDQDVDSLLSRNPDIPGSICGELFWRYCHAAGSSAGLIDRVRPLLARYDLPAPLLFTLAQDVRVEVRLVVAKAVALPLDGVALLAADSEPEVRACIASRKDLSVALVEKLALDHSLNVLLILATHKNAPALLIERLAADKDPLVRAKVALSPSLSLALMRRLADDKVESVRFELAKNHRLHRTVMSKLEQDPSVAVRQVLLETHAKVLRRPKQ
jgi:hypothetical protein